LKDAPDGNAVAYSVTVSPMSGSVALTVNSRGDPAVTDSGLGTVREGGWLPWGGLVVTLTETETECCNEPLVLLIDTSYSPSSVDEFVSTVRIEEVVPPGGRLLVPGFNSAEGPEGHTVTVNRTSPEKPLRLAS